MVGAFSQGDFELKKNKKNRFKVHVTLKNLIYWF